MQVTSMNAETFLNLFLAAAKNLDANRDWINELNVFPVPDGDTGTNMTMTIMSAAKEAGAIEHPTLADLSRAISSGSLRGARGNSGVILSQLLRGFCKAMREYQTLDVSALADANERAVETAYKAVMKPKEGTILTVARAMAERSQKLCEETDDLTVFMDELIKCGDEALARTPDQLPILKESGVIDSGGQGLMILLKGANDALLGKEIASAVNEDLRDFAMKDKKPDAAPARTIPIDTGKEIKFGYCTEFIIMTDRPMDEEEEAKYKAYLESIGDSIVVVADEELVKTHVHTNDPGLAMQKALTYGGLTNIKVDNMRLQHEAKRTADAQKLADEQKEMDLIHQAAEQEEEKKQEQMRRQPPKEVGFVAVSLGRGMDEIFTGLGVDQIVDGGQTMNPSTEDLMKAIEAVNAKTVFVLPNNKNIVLAAEQAASLTKDKQVVVIPSRNVPQGISAMINFIPNYSVEENARLMVEEMEGVCTGQVTYAVRDTVIDGFVIHEHDYMGIGDSGMLAAGEKLNTVVEQMVEQMVNEDSAIISIYFGEDVTSDAAQALADALSKKYTDLEVEVNEGSQPVYYYVISVE